MSNMQRETTPFSTITTSTLLIVLMTVLAFSSGLNIQSFGQEEDNSDDAMTISGRIIV